MGRSNDLCCIVDLLTVVMATHFCSILSLHPRHLPMLGSLLRGAGTMKGVGPQRGKGQKGQRESIARTCFAVLEQLTPAVFSDPEVCCTLLALPQIGLLGTAHNPSS